jgi:ribosome hibernation promoting factor
MAYIKFMPRRMRQTQKGEAPRPRGVTVSVSGKNLAISAALKATARKRFRALARRYFGNSLDAALTVSREGPGFSVECELRPVPGVSCHARAERPELLPAIEEAIGRAEKQLRRFKRRITNHHDSARRPKRKPIQA